mmetsp:Transcript_27848/g.24640  ORF Transcript_27848/g.24640 Transcript_27848/m.24640 type:complete len:149 (+) Transcript_27848:34-480(+)|eukprot:CAMPEP_0201590260 /NCGR_PEP_ID=MMETSP0190_2-20130828/175884_1 /ASSEMBLY_ACC=CAM_ASM_000263 /TAXON_ID=37353 /ORGANISM="Rosalina sp." /LENGTH=148 /DNA_ID=CAMNT_0048046049 /DNA_START=34 /DNA_END=480 /DNA_ORIENTATION=+
MGNANPYENHYAFKKDNIVIIKHQLGMYLRSQWPLNEGTGADPDGGQNDVSEFEIDLQNNGNRCRLKHVKAGKYLRIFDGGNAVNIAGNGGKFTVFKIHRLKEPGKCKLESVAFPGKYIAVGRQNKVRVGAGGKWCELEFFRKDKDQQ